eukprot:superscaffoldBa00010509_g24748
MWEKEKEYGAEIKQAEEEEEKASIIQKTREQIEVHSRKTSLRPHPKQTQHFAMPLITAGNGGQKYRPFGLGDVQAIVDKMPPISEGGGRWLGKLDSLTAGQTMALGDFRAVACRCMSSAEEKEIEQEAKTHRLDDNTPLLHVVDDLGQALRNKYPLPNTAAVPKMKWDGEQNPREYLDKCKDMWTQQTGCHPGKPGVQQEWYRQAILEGIPETVKNAMKDNPDMAGCDSHTWEKHLIHHLTRALDKVQEEKATIKDLQSQLLKLQLGEARQKVNEAKKKDVKNNTVMVAAATGDMDEGRAGDAGASGEADLEVAHANRGRRDATSAGTPIIGVNHVLSTKDGNPVDHNPHRDPLEAGDTKVQLGLSEVAQQGRWPSPGEETHGTVGPTRIDTPHRKT